MAKKDEKKVDEIKGEKNVDEIKGEIKVDELKVEKKKKEEKKEDVLPPPPPKLESYDLNYFGSQEFGRDTNRLDYFRTAPFDVHGDNHFSTGIADYGGGRNRDHGTGRVDGGDMKTREVPNGFSFSDGGSRRRHQLVQERGSSIVRPGGGYWVQEAPVGVFPNNGSHDREPEVQRLIKQEGINIPMSVAVAVVVMMMLMMVVMVVLVLVLVLVWVMLKTAVTR
ncbi:hypothetical protein LXL04_032613 [Taraxacum kok-saghyz]